MSHVEDNQSLKSPLFRQQAMQYLSTSNYGTVLLKTSKIFPWITTFFFVLVFCIVSFFFLFSTSRKAICQGVLVPNAGVQRVVSSQSGVISFIHVKEGQTVKAGEVLFTLTNERGVKGGDANKVISSLVKRRLDSLLLDAEKLNFQNEQKILALNKRYEALKNEGHKLDEQIQLQEQRVKLAESAFQRFQDLQATHFLSTAQLQDKQAEWIDQRQKLADLKRTLGLNQRELSSTQAEIIQANTQGKRDIAGLHRDANTLRQELTESEIKNIFEIRALQDGVVTAITGRIGQSVIPNTGIASLLPYGTELEAEIYATSRSVGFIKSGMNVLLRYQAYPYQKFGQHRAKVIEVADTALKPEEFSLPGATSSIGISGDPLYRIRLKLENGTVKAYGKDMPLKSGMSLDASVILEERRLIEWILEPLYTISGRT